MIRLKFILFALLCIGSCYAQLSKFEGTWINTSSGPWWDGKQFNNKRIIKIIVDGSQVYIRQKDQLIFEGGKEETTYKEVKDIEVHGDSLIRFQSILPRRWRENPDPVHSPIKNQLFNNFVISSSEEIYVKGRVLIEKCMYTMIDYYYDDMLVDKEISDGDKKSDIYYNEKDNW